MKASLLFLIAGLFSVELLAKPICSSDSTNTALIVIDMQPAFVTRNGHDQLPGNKAKVEKVIKEQIAAIKQAKDANIPIVFLEHEGVYVEKAEDAETARELKNAVANYRNVKFLKKNTTGMFSDNNLHRQKLVDHLAKHNVGTLIVMGANGSACVFDSIVEAIKGNCSVVAFNKGIADFNSEKFIYPYVGQYAKIKSSSNRLCKDCSFREVSSLDGAIPAQIMTPSRQTIDAAQ